MLCAFTYFPCTTTLSTASHTHTHPPTSPPQLGVLLEWCRIRQLSLIGQMRSNYCCHSVLDQLADVAVRAAAALRWEPELRQMQGAHAALCCAVHAVHAVLLCAVRCCCLRWTVLALLVWSRLGLVAGLAALSTILLIRRCLLADLLAPPFRSAEQERQANMLALQQELEAEAAQAEKRAARAEKRKAQKTKRAAAAAEQANGVGNGGTYSSDSEEEQATQQVAQPPRQQQQAAAEPRQKAAAQPPASPNKAAAASKVAKKGEGKQTAATERSSQAAAYQRMLEEYGLDAEAASFAQQLAAKQAPRQQDGAAPPAAAAKQQQAATAAAPAAPAGSPAKTASGKAAILVPPVTVKAPPPPPTAAKVRPASAPAGSSSGGGGSAPGAAGAGGGSSGEPGSNTVLVKPHGARELMRVIGYYGDWLCFCGDVNKLWDTCACGQAPPCRCVWGIRTKVFISGGGQWQGVDEPRCVGGCVCCSAASAAHAWQHAASCPGCACREGWYVVCCLFQRCLVLSQQGLSPPPPP